MRKQSSIGMVVGGIVLAASSALLAQGALAQSPLFAYPKANQSPEQQSKDKAECHQWSVQQTGFDPTVPAAEPQQTAS